MSAINTSTTPACQSVEVQHEQSSPSSIPKVRTNPDTISTDHIINPLFGAQALISPQEIKNDQQLDVCLASLKSQLQSTVLVRSIHSDATTQTEEYVTPEEQKLTRQLETMCASMRSKDQEIEQVQHKLIQLRTVICEYEKMELELRGDLQYLERQRNAADDRKIDLSREVRSLKEQLVVAEKDKKIAEQVKEAA